MRLSKPSCFWVWERQGGVMEGGAQSPPFWLVHLGWVWGAGRPHLYLLRKDFQHEEPRISALQFPQESKACTDRRSAWRSAQPQGAAG